MKTLLILGAGREQVAAIERARAKAIRTVVLDQNPDAQGRGLADEFHPVSTRDHNALFGFARDYDGTIDGVMTIASDIPHMVSMVADMLGARHIPIAVAELCVDKLRMKERLRETGVNVPAFTRVKKVEDLRAFAAKVGYPVVIKPVDNSGARGVLRLTEKTDLGRALAYASEFSSCGKVMAEKFIDGLQISTEGLMLDDVFHCTGFADRNYSRLSDADPFLIEDGGDIPTALAVAEKKQVEEEFEKATRALGIDWGPSKGDMIFGADGRPYVIEIAARLSGGNFCTDKVPWATGVDIVDVLIDMAVGNPVDPARFKPTRRLAASQRYFFPSPGQVLSIRGITAAERVPYVRKVDVWTRPGEEITVLQNHPSRVGYAISVAPSRLEAVAAAEAAVSCVKFLTAPYSQSAAKFG